MPWGKVYIRRRVVPFMRPYGFGMVMVGLLGIRVLDREDVLGVGQNDGCNQGGSGLPRHGSRSKHASPMAVAFHEMQT